jgi:hypothetical protein
MVIRRGDINAPTTNGLTVLTSKNALLSPTSTMHPGDAQPRQPQAERSHSREPLASTRATMAEGMDKTSNEVQAIMSLAPKRSSFLACKGGIDVSSSTTGRRAKPLHAFLSKQSAP